MSKGVSHRRWSVVDCWYHQASRRRLRVSGIRGKIPSLKLSHHNLCLTWTLPPLSSISTTVASKQFIRPSRHPGSTTSRKRDDPRYFRHLGLFVWHPRCSRKPCFVPTRFYVWKWQNVSWKLPKIDLAHCWVVYLLLYALVVDCWLLNGAGASLDHVHVRSTVVETSRRDAHHEDLGPGH